MDIIIKAIPHSAHRYPTCGDWWYDADGHMHIRVSQELPQLSQDLVVIHELAEARMCYANGVTQKQVDDYDMNFEANRVAGDDSEPGDHLDAPYFKQHQLATIIEAMVATQMGVNWEEHERDITALFEPPKVTEPDPGFPPPQSPS
jgi:hypothetical protein